MPVSHLSIASLVAVCCSIALIVLFIAIPLASLTSTRAPYWSAILTPIGLIGLMYIAQTLPSVNQQGDVAALRDSTHAFSTLSKRA